MTPHDMDSSALIVGAGPTGLTLAIELARRGVPCRIIDASPPHPIEQSRALGIQARTLEIFDAMGFVDEILAQGRKIHGLRVHADARKIASLRLDALDSPYPFAFILPQGQTERTMQAYLERLGVTVERECKLLSCYPDGDHAHFRLQTAGGEETGRTRWLIGCDGAHSAVRHALNLSFEGAQFPEAFALADVRLSGQFPTDTVDIYLSNRGVVGIIPIRDALFRLVADLPGLPPEQAPDPTLEEMQRLLDERGPGGIDASDPVWLSNFKIHRRIASTFREGAVFLAGDSAHIHSPAGGQGMNTGIQDAYNLGWKLAGVMKGHSSDALLDTYNIERRPVALNVLRGTDLVTRAITLHHPLARKVRNILASFLSDIKPVRSRLSKDVAELDIAYHKNIAIEDRSGLRGPAAGERAPDGRVIDAGSGRALRVFDLFRHGGWTLLIFCNGERPSCDALTERLREFEDLQSYVIVPRECPTPALQDPDGALHEKYCVSAPCLYLIRPDGYVGFRGPLRHPEALERYLWRVTASHATP